MKAPPPSSILATWPSYLNLLDKTILDISAVISTPHSRRSRTQKIRLRILFSNTLSLHSLILYEVDHVIGTAFFHSLHSFQSGYYATDWIFIMIHVEYVCTYS